MLTGNEKYIAEHSVKCKAYRDDNDVFLGEFPSVNKAIYRLGLNRSVWKHLSKPITSKGIRRTSQSKMYNCKVYLRPSS